MKRIITLLLSMIMMTTAIAGCSSNEGKKDTSKTPEVQKEEDKAVDSADLYANKIGFTIEMEDGGIMKGELYPDVAPISVANFVKLAENKFFDGLIFHRVIRGFMIQGGGFDKDFKQKEAEAIKGEFEANGVTNDLKHTRGVISMARTNVPDSASSQFFIMHKDSPHLDGQYAAFGKVTEGLDIIDEIAETPTTVVPDMGMSDVPAEPQIIKTITIQK